MLIQPHVINLRYDKEPNRLQCNSLHCNQIVQHKLYLNQRS